MHSRLPSGLCASSSSACLPAGEEPPVERAVREAGLDLGLETGNGRAALEAARSLLEALRRTAADARPGGAENAVAMFLLLSRRVCERLCGDVEEEEEGNGNGDAGLN